MVRILDGVPLLTTPNLTRTAKTMDRKMRAKHTHSMTTATVWLILRALSTGFLSMTSPWKLSREGTESIGEGKKGTRIFHKERERRGPRNGRKGRKGKQGREKASRATER